METHGVRDIRIDVPRERVFRFVADPQRLPEWTHAFASIDGSKAMLKTPSGEVRVGLEVSAQPEPGTIDWRMTFPDGTVETAYSRVVPADAGSTVFTFVLLPPHRMLERLEGGLEQQTEILGEELHKLKRLLENSVQN